MGDTIGAFLGRMASRATRAMMEEVDLIVDAIPDCCARDSLAEAVYFWQ